MIQTSERGRKTETPDKDKLAMINYANDSLCHESYFKGEPYCWSELLGLKCGGPVKEYDQDVYARNARQCGVASSQNSCKLHSFCRRE